jgi:hypothetical protein
MLDPTREFNGARTNDVSAMNDDSFMPAKPVNDDHCWFEKRTLTFIPIVQSIVVCDVVSVLAHGRDGACDLCSVVG